MSEVSSQSPPPLPQDHNLREIITTRYVNAVRAAVNNSPSTMMIGLMIIIVLMLTVVLSPLAFWLFKRWNANRRGAEIFKTAINFSERAVAVMAFPLMVNSMLRRPGGKGAPGLFLISFDERHGGSIDFMSDLALKVGEASSADSRHAYRDFCKSLFADENFVAFRRRKLPLDLTNGIAAYTVDLAIQPRLLTDGFISNEMPLVPCMAEPGENGRIIQMRVAVGRDAPTRDDQAEFIMSLGLIHEFTKWGKNGGGR